MFCCSIQKSSTIEKSVFRKKGLLGVKLVEHISLIWALHKILPKPVPKQDLVLTCLQYKSFENSVGKVEIACNEQFLLFPQCLLPVLRATLQLLSAASLNLGWSQNGVLGNG